MAILRKGDKVICQLPDGSSSSFTVGSSGTTLQLNMFVDSCRSQGGIIRTVRGYAAKTGSEITSRADGVSNANLIDKGFSNIHGIYGSSKAVGLKDSYSSFSPNDRLSVLQEQVSEADGAGKQKVKDFFGNLFKGKKDKVDPKKADEISNKAEELYRKSGSKKSFADWAKTDGKNLINTLVGVTSGIASSGASSSPSSNQDFGNDYSQNENNDKPRPATNTKILGMHPITFTLVAILGTATIVAVGVHVFKGKGKKSK